ncbi:MAG: hypothetical protein U0941_16080 [Planctomycetaceae bacterium]
MTVVPTEIRLGRSGCGRSLTAGIAVSPFRRQSLLAPYFLPPFPMGQYFKAVNFDKKEVVCPWCLSGGAKLWEWAANSYGAIFTLLLRKSSAAGGGDYYGYPPRMVQMDSPTDMQNMLSEIAEVEGQPIAPDDTIVGRWAGDRVALVGDYDSSKLWDELPTYRNISKDVVETWNQFMDLDDRKLTYNPDCSCGDC